MKSQMLEYLDFEKRRNTQELDINCPGVYFFHLKPNKVNLTTVIERVIHQQRKNEYSAIDNSRQSLKYKFETTPEKFTTHLDCLHLEKNQRLFEVLQFLFKTKTPPLYIGMSKNLGQRLSTHFTNLSYIFKQLNSTSLNDIINIESDPTNDNSISLSFMLKFERFMNELREIPDIKLPSENSVYFEYIRLDRALFSIEEIREIESILININHPILNTKYK